MNAHHETNSGAFGMSGFLFAQHHCAEVLTTLDDVCTYTWNYRNEMTGFSEKNASGTVIASGTHTYDSLDLRIRVDETSGGVTTQTWIVYNGNSNTPYAQFNGSGTLLERYLAGPSYVPGVTGPAARTNASGVTDWYLTGKLGSVRDIVNTSGTVIDHISYGAFGSIRAETNPSSGSRFKFDGMRYETNAGLYNDRHRGYSSLNGIFDSLDPTGFQSNSDNLYIHVSNNPGGDIDPNSYENVPQINIQPINIPPIDIKLLGLPQGAIVCNNPEQVIIPTGDDLRRKFKDKSYLYPEVINAAESLNELSKDDLLERGVGVYLFNDGSIRVGIPGYVGKSPKRTIISCNNIGTNNHINFTNLGNPPKGWTLIATIHTHPPDPNPIYKDPANSPLDPINSNLPIGESPRVPWLIIDSDNSIYLIRPGSRDGQPNRRSR
jgi:RHS repeat-associated protein